MSGTVRRIGIGIDKDAEKVIDSANRVSGNFITVCYCRSGVVDKKTLRNAAVQIVEHANPEQALIDDLVAGRIDAAVRCLLYTSPSPRD